MNQDVTSIVSDRRSLWHRFWPALIIVVLWLWVFWPLITGQQVAGFRDSAYLYYPLFKFIDMEWASGVIPLWNLYDGAGQPLMADGSSSVFYPGKLIFLCRFFSFPTRYGLYLSIHVLLAAATSYYLAKILGCNRLGRTTAAISYAFGGSVLFQVNNVIYLVGAAWLPLALCCVWMMFQSTKWRWPLLGAAVCALMLLGGDPQMVYNVGLIAAATLIGTWISRSRQAGPIQQSGFNRSWVAGKSLRLLVFVGVAGILSAIQLLPSYEMVKSSKRAQQRSLPSNIYGTISSSANGSTSQARPTVAEGLLGTPRPGTHQSHIYEFSLPPWSLAELVWPNVSGKPFPIHNRWTDGLPGADRMWVPSIYLGVLPLILAICSFRLWGQIGQDIWLSRVAIWFTLASFGWYGVVWFAGELGHLLAMSQPSQTVPDATSWQFGPQVGGLYWLMVIALPKYFWFRYPAKLFVIAALAISILAGRTLSKRLPGRLITGLGVGTLLLSLLGCLLVFWAARWAEPVRDPIFGPLQMGQFPATIIAALLQSVLVLVVGLLVLKRMTQTQPIGSCSATVFLAILIADLVVANTWMLAAVPVSAFESPVEPAYTTRAPWGESANSIRFKNSHPKSNPYQGSGFSEEPSANRLVENIVWQREVLFPKHHLPLRIINPNSFSSIEPDDSQSGMLSLIDQYKRVLGDSLKMELGSNSFELTFDVPEDSPAQLLPSSVGGPWRIQLMNQMDGRQVFPTIVTVADLEFYQIPAGSWRIRGFYWPESFVRGAVISLVGWSAWLVVMCLLYVRKQRRDHDPLPAVVSPD